MKKLLLLLWALTLLAGCNESKPVQTEKPKPKETELLTGRFAFYKMYPAARNWAHDVQGYSLESQANSDSSGKDGKASVWRAGFASPAGHGEKPYSWSGTDAQDAPSRGVNFGSEDNYSPSNSTTQVFDIAFFKVDSDAAYEVSQKHGGDKILAAAADTPITYRLDWNRSTTKLVWHVTYGTGVVPKLRVAVDATSGDFIRLEK
jgi:hypothetical protein